MHIYACTHDGTSPVDIYAKESTFLIGSLGQNLSKVPFIQMSGHLLDLISSLGWSPGFLSYLSTSLFPSVPRSTQSHLGSISSCPAHSHLHPGLLSASQVSIADFLVLPHKLSPSCMAGREWLGNLWHTWHLLSVTSLSNNP